MYIEYLLIYIIYIIDILFDGAVDDNNTNSGAANMQSKLNNTNDDDQYSNDDDDDEGMKGSEFIIQPLKIVDNTSEDVICYLWYIPSQIEIVMVYSLSIFLLYSYYIIIFQMFLIY